MAYQTINASEIIAGEPTKESLIERIVENLDYHEAQISSLGASGNQTTVFNQIIKFPEIPVGTPIYSWDILDNIKTAGFSSKWITCSGSGSWTDGSGASRTTPDARSRFLRYKFDGYSTVNTGDTVGDSTKLPNSYFTGTTTYQSAATTSNEGYHSHYVAAEVVGAVNISSANSLAYSASVPFNYTFRGNASTAANVGLSSFAGSHTHTLAHTHNTRVTGGGDSETAPHHIYLNLIFKSEYSWGAFRLLYKASSTFTITTVNLTKIEAATAASVATIDVRKASTAQLSSGSGDVSILSTLPSITDDGSTDFVESSGVIKTDGTEDIATNDWLYVDFTSKIKGACEYHIQVVGS